MSCEIPGEVLRYITSVENDMPKACKEQHALAAYIRRVFAEDCENTSEWQNIFHSRDFSRGKSFC